MINTLNKEWLELQGLLSEFSVPVQRMITDKVEEDD